MVDDRPERLSRVADAVYWMSRYIERAENVARFLDVNYNLMLDLPYVSGVTVSVDALARGLGARGHEVRVIAPRPARGAEPGDVGSPGPAPEIAWLDKYFFLPPVLLAAALFLAGGMPWLVWGFCLPTT